MSAVFSLFGSSSLSSSLDFSIKLFSSLIALTSSATDLTSFSSILSRIGNFSLNWKFLKLKNHYDSYFSLLLIKFTCHICLDLKVFQSKFFLSTRAEQREYLQIFDTTSWTLPFSDMIFTISLIADGSWQGEGSLRGRYLWWGTLDRGLWLGGDTGQLRSKYFI